MLPDGGLRLYDIAFSREATVVDGEIHDLGWEYDTFRLAPDAEEVVAQEVAPVLPAEEDAEPQAQGWLSWAWDYVLGAWAWLTNW